MDNKNSNELIVVKENLLDKIKNFFRKLFSKQQQDKIEEVEEVEEKENSFIKNVKIEEDNEEKRLLKLQTLILTVRISIHH